MDFLYFSNQVNFFAVYFALLALDFFLLPYAKDATITISRFIFQCVLRDRVSAL